jgi:glycerophosphoryl diester phosphodiesterase
MNKFIFLIIAVYCVNSAHSFVWVGHRGARGLYPENTTQGMREALKYPEIKTLELDIVISKDGEVVVSHEPWMNPDICLNPQGAPVKAKADNFYKMTYAQIAAFDCGSKYYPDYPRQAKVVEHKPRLLDLLRAVEFEALALGKRPAYFIEIKSTRSGEKDGFQPSVPVFMDKVIAVLEQVLTDEQIYIISLDWRTLEYAHAKRPHWKTVALGTIPLSAAGVVHRLGFTPTVFAPFYPIFPKLAMKAFKRRGIKIIPWTVNESRDMQKLVDKGVDGIITDYPDLISQIRMK